MNSPMPLEIYLPNMRKKSLMQQCRFVPSFEVEGRRYKGYPSDAVEEYIKYNPQPADFSVWLQNNWQQIK